MRVEIDDQHLLADGRQRRAEIDGGRGLADAALLVGDRQHPRRSGIGTRGGLPKGTTCGSAGVGRRISVMVSFPSIARCLGGLSSRAELAVVIAELLPFYEA